MSVEHERSFGLGMDALVTLLLLEHERYLLLGMDALFQSEFVVSYMPAMVSCKKGVLCRRRNYCLFTEDALVIVCTRTCTLLCFGHGCSGDRMLLERERYSGSGIDARVTNVILV